MGLIRNDENKNISVATVNGYTAQKVLKAKRYLREIGSNRRNFSIERLVEMYNDVKGTREKAAGCKPCQATKFYNGLQNYAYFGEMTLINNGKATKEDLDIDLQDARESGFTTVEEAQTESEIIMREHEEMVEEEKKRETMKERMAKVRAAKKNKKKEEEEG